MLTNLARLLQHGRLGGRGKLLILPVDQGFEHGPLKSFAPNPDAYDPQYHFALAVEAGLSAYAAPLGFLEAGAREFAGQVPLILKLNNADLLYKSETAPQSALTSCVDDALRLGCVGVGFTIYPGSARSRAAYEQLQAVVYEAKQKGLVVVVWAYPRGEGLRSSADNTAVQVVSYAAHIAAQLGAHIIKVKPPTCCPEGLFSDPSLQAGRLSKMVSLVLESCFAKKRIVLFSGGGKKSKTELLEEIRQMLLGGAFGSIVGRNVFYRPRGEALDLLDKIVQLYLGQSESE